MPTTTPLSRLIAGYQDFRRDYLSKTNRSYRAKAAESQEPKVMIIGCSDSRLDPKLITGAMLGEIFSVDNVANLVPPYKEGQDTHHSTSSAIEFACEGLAVEHIIILGHSGCGGIRALMEQDDDAPHSSYSFIRNWMSIAAEAKQMTIENLPDDNLDSQCRYCEKQSLLVSLRNLRGFHWVADGQNAGRISTHAWYFDIWSGQLEAYCDSADSFVPILEKYDIPTP